MGINQLTRHHVMANGTGRVPVFVELPKRTWTALLIARAHAAQDLLDILLRQRWKAPLAVHSLDRGADMGIVLPLRLQARRIAKERVVARTRADLLRQREAWARCAARARLSRRRCRAHEIQERQDVGIRLGDPDLLRRREPRVAPAVGVYRGRCDQIAAIATDIHTQGLVSAVAYLMVHLEEQVHAAAPRDRRRGRGQGPVLVLPAGQRLTPILALALINVDINDDQPTRHGTAGDADVMARVGAPPRARLNRIGQCRAAPAVNGGHLISGDQGKDGPAALGVCDSRRAELTQAHNVPPKSRSRCERHPRERRTETSRRNGLTWSCTPSPGACPLCAAARTFGA